MTGILIILLILFFIGLPFYWIYKWIFKKKEASKTKEHSVPHIKPEFEPSELIKKTEFMFMDDYRMWKSLSKTEKEERLSDIQVILDYGKDHITREMIKKGFEPGSKIIDIKYFTGLSEHGFTITTFTKQYTTHKVLNNIFVNGFVYGSLREISYDFPP